MSGKKHKSLKAKSAVRQKPFNAAAKKAAPAKGARVAPGAKPAKVEPKAVKQPAPKSAAKGPQGAIGSLKKMLGLGGAKAPEAKKGAAPAGKNQVAGAKPAAAPATSGRGGRGRGKAISDLPKTQLETSLRPQKDATTEVPHGAPVCREVACELMATTGGYCRMHYIKNWKKIKRKEIILREKKLNSYIEELVSKYPDKYIEAIRQDLASEKDFAKVISDLEIDEGMDDFESVETEGAEGLIDNLKREFDDDGEVF